MAEWRGMKVKLNSPSPIRKGEPGYGRKKSKGLCNEKWESQENNVWRP